MGWGGRGGGSCKEREPHTVYGLATVKVRHGQCTMNVQCFHNASVGQV